MKTPLESAREYRLIELRAWRERLVIWMAAICASLVVVGFTMLTQWCWNETGKLGGHSGVLSLLLPPLAGMVIVYLVRRWFPAAAGSGIPQTMAAIESMQRGESVSKLVSMRIAIAKVGFGAMAVGCGFSMGREGPSVQVAASVMHAFRHLLPKGYVIHPRHLVLAGGAAGIAAAFNTPLAGVVFAIEELSRSFEQSTNGVILTSIVLSGMVSISLQGNYLYFGHLAVGRVDSKVVLPVLLISLVCGMLGGWFSRLLVWSARPWPGTIGQWRERHPVWFAGVCGVIVGLLGYATHGSVLGSGYDASRAVLSGSAGEPWTFAPGKYLATLASYFSGVPGGIFAPALSIGVGIGQDLLPVLGGMVSSVSILALCMTGFLAAVTQAPITSCIIVMEMIDGHEMVISLIAVSLFSSLLSRLFSPSLYGTLAREVSGRTQPAPVPAVPS